MIELFALKNKVTFVTGASSGLGRHFSLTLAQAGADVMIGALHSTLVDLKVVANEIEALGRKVLFLELDVTQKNSVDVAIE